MEEAYVNHDEYHVRYNDMKLQNPATNHTPLHTVRNYANRRAIENQTAT